MLSENGEISRTKTRQSPSIFQLSKQPYQKTLEFVRPKTPETLENILEKKRSKNDPIFCLTLFFISSQFPAASSLTPIGVGFIARRRQKKMRILNPEMRFPKGKSIFRRSGFSKFSRIPPRVQGCIEIVSRHYFDTNKFFTEQPTLTDTVSMRHYFDAVMNWKQTDTISIRHYFGAPL